MTFQTTASESALIAAVAARNTYMDSHPGARHEDLVMLCTTQTHSLALKAGRVLGLAVCTIDVDAKDAYGLRGEGLAQAIANEQAKGHCPFFLSAATCYELPFSINLCYSRHNWHHVLRCY